MNWKEIVMLVIAILGGAFMGALPKLRELAKKTPTNLDDVALDIVVYVNSLFNGDKGESKKQRAKDLIEQELAKTGAKVTEQVLDKTVEKAVTKMKLAQATAPKDNKGE